MKHIPDQAHNTAISRDTLSAPVCELIKRDLLDKKKSVLDFGCGKGADQYWLNHLGYDALGYDPHEDFGFDELPKGTFDTVVMVYVLNTVPYLRWREAALQQAWKFTKSGGHLFVASRGKSEIERCARDGNWGGYQDGFVSDQARRTFQKGHDFADLRDMVAKLRPEPVLIKDLKMNCCKSAWALR